jgi:5-dehydro-2-deoxygluconokinase
MTDTEIYDVLTVGRSSIDLYSQNIGAPFEEIEGFNAYVGGSPLNMAVGCRRLGMKAALLTGVGQDKVGDFILNFLENEGVETRFIPRIPHARSSAVVLGIEPPDRFPLVYYRDNCADTFIDIDHVIQAGIHRFRMLEVSGTALSREPSRSASFLAAELAQKDNIPVVLDLDFRADQWDDIRSYGIMCRYFLKNVNIAIGTEEEILAAVLTDIGMLSIEHQQISAPEIRGNLEEGIATLLENGIDALIIKRGKKGASVHLKDGTVTEVPGFPVEVLNILGAGDAFGAGFMYGYLQGWDWYKSCRMANACGAYIVTQPGCANFNPTLDQINAFIEERGGF